jgi:hypothetical protein
MILLWLVRVSDVECLMKLEVDCYAGRKADERPVRIRLGECTHVVEEVLDQWYGPEDAFYKVRADDGTVFVLRQNTSSTGGSWHLVSIQANAER